MSKGVFWAIVVAVAANAALGCLALIFGDLDDNGPTDAARILMTSFSFTVACFVGLPSALAIGEKRGYVLAAVGLSACVIAEALILFAVWTVPDDETFWRGLLTAVAIAGAASIANLFWNQGFSWGKHSMRRAGLLWLAVATPLALATIWVQDGTLAAKLLTTAGALAVTAALGGLLWNDRFHPLRNVVRSGWVLWLGLSTGLTIWALWLENDDLWLDVWASSWTLLLSLGHYSLVMMAKLNRRFVVVKIAALFCNVVVTGIALYGIWAETLSDNMARFGAVFIVLAAGFTVLAPIFQRQSGPQLGKPDRTSFCPHCGAFLNLNPGDATCETCGARFRVEFRRSARTVQTAPSTIGPLQGLD
jgi:hypothetical protein